VRGEGPGSPYKGAILEAKNVKGAARRSEVKLWA